MEILREKNCRIVDGAGDWQDAIRISVEPLEEEGDVEPRYKEEIIKNVETLGPCFVLAPGVAMPHARPEQGAVNTQIAVTLLRHPVSFDEEDDPIRKHSKIKHPLSVQGRYVRPLYQDATGVDSGGQWRRRASVPCSYTNQLIQHRLPGHGPVRI